MSQKESLENTRKIRKHVSLIPYSPSQELTNPDFIEQALIECLKNNDLEGIIEIISSYLHALEKTNNKEK
jgi:hypothetical protein